MKITEFAKFRTIYIAVGADPAVTSKEGSDDIATIVAGKSADGHVYVLGDYIVHYSAQKFIQFKLQNASFLSLKFFKI